MADTVCQARQSCSLSRSLLLFPSRLVSFPQRCFPRFTSGGPFIQPLHMWAAGLFLQLRVDNSSRFFPVGTASQTVICFATAFRNVSGVGADQSSLNFQLSDAIVTSTDDAPAPSNVEGAFLSFLLPSWTS